MLTKIDRQMFTKIGQQMVTKIGQQMLMKIDQQMLTKLDQQLFTKIGQQMLTKIDQQLLTKVGQQMLTKIDQQSDRHLFTLFVLSRTSDNTTSKYIGGKDAWAVPSPQILGGPSPSPPRYPPMLNRSSRRL